MTRQALQKVGRLDLEMLKASAAAQFLCRNNHEESYHPVLIAGIL
jgi:hypothetical protein